MRVSVDDRRLGIFDIFPSAEAEGDISIIRLYPSALSAWHRHQHQTDRFFCVSGTVKFGTIAPGQVVEWLVLDEHELRVLYVPPHTWHGYQCLSANGAILLAWTTPKWDGADEERRSIDAMGASWERVPR